MDKKLKTMGGISPEMMEAAKAAMLDENVDFSEPTPPSARSGAGYPSTGGFIETHFNFATCQRPDGSYYGTGGTCKKGTPVNGVPEKEKKGSSKSGGGGDVATAPAPKKTTSKDPVKNVLNEQQKTKDFLKKDNAKMAKDNPKLAKMQKDMEARKAKEKAAQEGGAEKKGGTARSGINKPTSDKQREAARAKQNESSDKAAAKRKVNTEMKPKVKEKDARAKDLNKEADRLDKAYKKQAAETKKNPTKENKARLKEIQDQTRRADKAAKKADREADKADREFQKALKAAEKGGASWANFFK